MKVGDLVYWGRRSGVVLEIYQSGSGWGSGRSIPMACVLSKKKMIRIPVSNLRELQSYV